jgi:hypothetical protein
MAGMGADPNQMGEVPTEPTAEEMTAEIDQQFTKDSKKAEL